MTIDQLGFTDYITAVAGLGTAAYALVDSSKAFWGGASNHGFGNIERVMSNLYPEDTDRKDRSNPLALASVLATLRASWLNGAALADQKAIAKSLVKLRLNEVNAEHLAMATGVDPATLAGIARNIANGTSLSQKESDVLGRFDLILTAMLDEGYQRADQEYRNAAKAWSVAVSVVLALAGGWIVNGVAWDTYVNSNGMWKAFLVGLIATPLAPVSKDLASALSASVKAMQLFKK
jgi:hypothetical protein